MNKRDSRIRSLVPALDQDRYRPEQSLPQLDDSRWNRLLLGVGAGANRRRRERLRRKGRTCQIFALREGKNTFIIAGDFGADRLDLPQKVLRPGRRLNLKNAGPADSS